MPRWDDPRAPHLRRFDDRYDRNRAGYARRDEDAGTAGYARRRPSRPGEENAITHGGEPYAYGGQEYGVEGHPFGADAAHTPGWAVEPDDDERRRNFDFEDPGCGQSQAGYAFATRAPRATDFDPEYVRWRDAKLRAYDRDYAEWRRDQQERYDEDYKREQAALAARAARDRNAPGRR